jgi:hypothetical protein
MKSDRDLPFSHKKSVRFRTSSILGLIALFSFTLAFSLKSDFVVDIPWGVIFVPLWVLIFLLSLVVHEIYSHLNSVMRTDEAKVTLCVGGFFIGCIFAGTLMAEIDVIRMWDCERSIKEIDTDNAMDVARVCNCNHDAMEDFLTYATCYWDSRNSLKVGDADEVRKRDDSDDFVICGERMVSSEEIRFDYMLKSTCEIRPPGNEMENMVTITLGNGCAHVIPYWVVVFPLLLIVFGAILYTIKTGGLTLSFTPTPFDSVKGDIENGSTDDFSISVVDDIYLQDDPKPDPIEREDLNPVATGFVTDDEDVFDSVEQQSDYNSAFISEEETAEATEI